MIKTWKATVCSNFYTTVSQKLLGWLHVYFNSKLGDARKCHDTLNRVHVVYNVTIRSSPERYSVKKVFLKNSQNSQQSACARASFLIKLEAWGNTFFYRTPLAAACGQCPVCCICLTLSCTTVLRLVHFYGHVLEIS